MDGDSGGNSSSGDPERADGPDASTEPLVACSDVSRTFVRGRSGSRLAFWRSSPPRHTVTALDSVSVAFRRGRFVGVTGPSGSGKSTLLHVLGGLDTPTAGTVEFEGQELAARSERALTRLRLERVGFVFQRFHLLPSLTARENVALPLIERGVSKAKRRSRASELLERVGLEDRETHSPGELSGGEKQRVAVARALVNDPDLVLADEPTGELDSESGATVLELLGEIAADRVVVVASHDDRVAGAADRVLELHDGRVQADE